MTKLKSSLPEALRRVRKARGLSQEAFSDVSSRTYLSSLERGLKSPTLNKVEELCDVLKINPLTLLILAYSDNDVVVAEETMRQAALEIRKIFNNQEM